MTIPSANRIQCNWNSHTSLVRIQNNILLWKTLWECPTELHTHAIYDPSNPLLHINPKEMKTCFYQNMYANIYSSFIHNCQKMEHPSIFQLVNKLWYIPTMEYYLAKEEWTTNIQINMVESQMHYAKWKKPHSSYIAYDCIYKEFWKR